MKSKLRWFVTFFLHVLELAITSADVMNVKTFLTHYSLFFYHEGLRGEGATVIICPECDNYYAFLKCGQKVPVERAANS